MDINISLENWTQAIHGKRGEVEVLIGKILFPSTRNKLPKEVYAHLFYFLLSQSTFTFYSVVRTWLCYTPRKRFAKYVIKLFKIKNVKIKKLFI